ncbi:methyl-accepting chemotaxis protein [Pseudomonas asiatica]|nr:methyl-accepting chemotaxis protein [Pseudomonas asiatica]MCE0850147.1 methyl-accepting chemotaxis protein [Pseudomonas asiatica]
MIKRLGFGHKILLAAVMLQVAAFGLFAAYNDLEQGRAIHRDLQRNLQSIAQVTAGSIQNWLSGRQYLLESLAEVLSQSDAEQRVRLLRQRTLKDAMAFVYLGTEEGKFDVFPDAQMAEGFDPRSRPWYARTREASQTQLTEPYVDANTGQLIMTMATPVAGVGVVGADLDLKALVQLINTLEFEGMGYAFLVDGQGKVLVHPDRRFTMQPMEKLFTEGVPSLQAGVLSNAVSEDGERIVTFMPVQGLPGVTWYLGISLSKQHAYALQDAFRWVAATATLVAVCSLLVVLSLLIRLLLRPLRVMTAAMVDIAEGEGDLTRRLPVTSRDELGLLAGAFNQFVERIQGSIQQVSCTMGLVEQVAGQVIGCTSLTIEGSRVQAERTGSIVAAVNQLGAAAQEIAGNATCASQQAGNARVQAIEGRDVVEHNVEAINQLSMLIGTSSAHIMELSDKTEAIGQILEVISAISQQTNLLALNAAIEAARAGEAGRGFAVVAEEVRNLAHRTQQSAHRVKQLIEELQAGAQTVVGAMQQSQSQTEQSVSIAAQAGQRLVGVTQCLEQMDGMNQSVAAATEEQTTVVVALHGDMNEVQRLNQAGSEQLQTTLAACTQLNSQLHDLSALIGTFRV